MTVKVEASEGGVPHDKIMTYGIIASLVGIYLTYLNVISGTQIFAFFGGLAAVAALVWGANTIKLLCSYGIGTGVPSAGMLALGSGIVAMILATTFGIGAPIAALIISAVLGALIGFLAKNVLNMAIPVMVRSLTELAMVGAMTVLGFAAMLGGSFIFGDMVSGSSTFLGVVFDNFEVSILGSALLATLFMLGGIAIQHPFNACLGPNESQDRTLMLAAECGFLSMIVISLMSIAFITTGSMIVSLLVSIIGWVYTYNEYIVKSKRDAHSWLDSQPIQEPKGGGE
ncbi:MAG: tetrahydromethanopterin S-methyltransferase subunit MtrC [Methanomicrobiales archaeon]